VSISGRYSAKERQAMYHGYCREGWRRLNCDENYMVNGESRIVVVVTSLGRIV
jgi:hypothetical protein